MPRSLALALGFSFLQASGAPAQDQPRTPSFGASANLVLVDFVVTGKSEALVAGLSAKDFVVKEDGRERPIVSFVAFAGGAPSEGAGPAEVVVVPFPSEGPPEAKAPGPITVLFVDDGQMSPQQAFRLRPALKKLIDTIAGRNGALALIAPWSKVSLANEVEGNRAVFGAAVDRITGRRVEDRSTLPISDAEAFAVERGDPTMLSRIALRFVSLNPGFDPDSAAAAARSRANEVARDARIRREDAMESFFNLSTGWSSNPGGTAWSWCRVASRTTPMIQKSSRRS